MRATPRYIAGLFALLALTACGGDGDDAEPAATTAAPASSTASASPSAPAATTSASPLLAALTRVCDQGGGALEDARSAFVDAGPSPSVAAQLLPLSDALVALQAELGSAGPAAAGTAELTAAAEDYQAAIVGLTVLYEQGETADQVPKTSGFNADERQDSAEQAWAAGVALAAPGVRIDAPTAFEVTPGWERTCG